MAVWQVQQAKAHLSAVIEQAEREGPQTITKHGKPRAVVLSAAAYDKLTQAQKPEPNFIDFLSNSGPILEDVDLERSKDTGREIDLE